MGYLAIGFITSAELVFAVASFSGTATGLVRVPAPLRAWAIAVACVLCIAVDLFMMYRSPLCSVGLRRQTPRAFLARYGTRVGPLLWGLDTGLVVTTIRVSAMTWIALLFAVLGLAPWWVGLAYGVGFIGPVVATTLLPRRHDATADGPQSEPQRIPRLLIRIRPLVRVACVVAMFVAAVAMKAP